MKKSVNILNMNIIGNPPFYEAKPTGKKRTAAHLDIKIWDKICKVFEKHEIVFIMSHSCNQMKNHGYTAISDEEQFPGVGISICIFERKPGEKPVEIIDKYEVNGWRAYRREHDMRGKCSHTLHEVIENLDLTQVPEGYIAFHRRSGKDISCWKAGEQTLLKNGKLSKTNCFIRTNNPDGLIKFIKDVVQPLYGECVDKYGIGDVDRGFADTIVVPEELI